MRTVEDWLQHACSISNRQWILGKLASPTSQGNRGGQSAMQEINQKTTKTFVGQNISQSNLPASSKFERPGITHLQKTIRERPKNALNP